MQPFTDHQTAFTPSPFSVAANEKLHCKLVSCSQTSGSGNQVPAVVYLSFNLVPLPGCHSSALLLCRQGAALIPSQVKLHNQYSSLTAHGAQVDRVVSLIWACMHKRSVMFRVILTYSVSPWRQTVLVMQGITTAAAFTKDLNFWLMRNPRGLDSK